MRTSQGTYIQLCMCTRSCPKAAAKIFSFLYNVYFKSLLSFLGTIKASKNKL